MFMEERVHPIPFRTRQLSSPSSMILRTLTWESRTTPRLYFQRAVLSRTALCFARSPSPSRATPPQGASLSCSFSPSPLTLGFPPPSFFSYGTRPVRSIIGSFASSPLFSRIHLSRGPENLWVRRRDVLIEMHGSHAVSMKKGREKGRDALGNSSPAT